MKKIIAIVLCFFMFKAISFAKGVEMINYEWTGKIGKLATYRLHLQCHAADSLFAGELTIKSTSKKIKSTTNPLLVVGRVDVTTLSDINANVYKSDGTIYACLTISNPSSDYAVGSFNINRTELPMTIKAVEKPTARTSLFVYDQRLIPGTYSYSYKDPINRNEYGGTAIFKKDGISALRFDISVVDHNIAEATNYDDTIPAILDENSFIYDMNDCDYGFKVSFYKRFLVIRQISGSANPDCFGAFTNLDGIYVRTSSKTR